MIAYALGRTFQAILTILGVITGSFFLVRLSGDPVAMMLPLEATDADIALVRTALGLDDSLIVQYGKYLWRMLSGDLGISIQAKTSALSLVAERLPATIELALSGFLVGLTIAFVLALAIRLIGSQQLRNAVLWIASVRQAVPVFWFGLLLILVFSVYLGWLPSIGRGGLEHLNLPALTIGTFETALYIRLFDSSLEQEQAQDYVRTAYAKGQSRPVVVLRHMLPNALLPLITIAGLNLGYLLGGAVVTETVFSWPGAGRMLMQAVNQRDYPVVLAGILVISFVFVVVNLLVDLLYAALDPRVRLA